MSVEDGKTVIPGNASLDGIVGQPPSSAVVENTIATTTDSMMTAAANGGTGMMESNALAMMTTPAVATPVSG